MKNNFEYIHFVELNAKLRAAELRGNEIIARLNASFLRKMYWRAISVRSRLRLFFRARIAKFKSNANPDFLISNKIRSEDIYFHEEVWGYSVKRGNSSRSNVPYLISTHNETVIFVHAHYTDSAEEIFKLLRSISNVDVIVTTSNSEILRLVKYWFRDARNIKILYVENRGRDVLPFLLALECFDLSKYKNFTKVHTKKSFHLSSGIEWYHKSVYSLLGCPSYFNELRRLVSVDMPLLVGYDTYPIQDHLDFNKYHLQSLIGDLVEAVNADFIPGTMFSGSGKFLQILKSEELYKLRFESESGQLDGTLAHAIERYFGYLCGANGGSVSSLHQLFASRRPME